LKTGNTHTQNSLGERERDRERERERERERKREREIAFDDVAQ